MYDSPPAVKDRLEPESLSILYVLLVHDYADFVTKIVEALDEPQHTFVIHVDLKAEHIQSTLKHYYEHVNIPTTLPSELDVNVDGMQLNSSIEYETDAEVEARSLGGGVNRNVYVMEQGREACNWGGFTIVNATLNAMKFALDHDVKFDYCMDVSGTSYPIKSKEVSGFKCEHVRIHM